MKALLLSSILASYLGAEVLVNVSYATTMLNSAKTMSTLYKTGLDNYTIQRAKYVSLYNSATKASVKTAYAKSIASYDTLIALYQKNLITYTNALKQAQINYDDTYAKYNPTPVDATYIPQSVSVKPSVPTLSSLEYTNVAKSYNMAGVQTAWNQGYTGKGITVAVIDTGLTQNTTDVNAFLKNTIDFGLKYTSGSYSSYTREILGYGNVSNVTVVASTGSKVYSEVPTVEVVGNGTGAKAQVKLDANGKISAIMMTDFGVGYTGTASVVIKDKNGVVDNSYTVNAYLAGVDYNGHGTATASLIAGAYDNHGVVGIAYDANIIPVKVGDGSVNTLDVIDGARLAVQRGATIINQSIEATALNATYVTAYADLIKSGVVVVQAAGNKGLDCKTTTNCNAYNSIPLTYDQKASSGAFIVAGALNTDGSDIASWSNRAGIAKDYFILASGSSVAVAYNNQVGSMSGTSFSAPIVSGTMALLQQKWPRLSGNQQAQILFQTADDMGVTGVDEVYGWGKLNINKAFSPVGDLKVPTMVSNVAGLKSAKTLTPVTTSVTGASLITAKLASFEGISNVMTFDSFERDYSINMSQYVSATKPTFEFNQFVTFPVSKHVFVGVNNTYSTPSVGYKNGASSYAYSYMNNVMGSEGTGLLGYKGNTHYFNYTRAEAFDELSYSVGFTVGYSNVKSSDDSIINMSDLVSVGANAKVLYNGFGVIGYIPSKIVAGHVSSTVATSSDINGNIAYSTSTMNLASNGYERTAGFVYDKEGLEVEVSKTQNFYGVEGLNSNNIKVKGTWYF